MIKIIHKNVVYYISDGAVINLDILTDHHLFQSSDIVIDSVTNKLLKCRYPHLFLANAYMEKVNEQRNQVVQK